MILVDSSVWIANLRKSDTLSTRKLEALKQADGNILVGDLILMEVLMGARDEAAAVRLDEDFRQFELVAISGPETVREAARSYRILRRLGATIRTGIDLLIGTFCIRFDHMLLHDDRDFTAMQQHLGLRVL